MTQQTQDTSDGHEVAMQWFHWQFDLAMRKAVEVHGADARGFAWTATEEFKRNMPSGHAVLFSETAICIKEDQDQ